MTGIIFDWILILGLSFAVGWLLLERKRLREENERVSKRLQEAKKELQKAEKELIEILVKQVTAVRKIQLLDVIVHNKGKDNS